ncbi:MAG: phosphatidylserine/phosphatidylglycerophosphate/cardiolipin synthase family protein [Candidatus Magasanikbacteria bacterium]|nr:phosphatidylserine/phosphatidylglycerophosphate/cardiolipin synthase family protein [Candidatus Magasanikbacteria bacterium]
MTFPFAYHFYRTTAEAWEAMFQGVSAATQSIYWEVYIFLDDEVGNRFIQLMCDKARAGVEVKLIIDAIGSADLSGAALARLRGSGVEVLRFHPPYPEFSWRHFWRRISHRTHRKTLIIDEETVFLGGVNIMASCGSWDDLHVEIRGPLVRPLLRAFAKSYLAAGGERGAVRHLLHPKLALHLPEWREWREKIRFIIHSPQHPRTARLRQLYRDSLRMARESVNLLTPYYVPDRQFLRAVAAARRRGVKVNLFIPTRLDHRIMEWAARAYYAATARAGADIFLLPRMHHGKAMSVDSTLGFIGSGNLNRRSFYWDEESGIAFSEANMVRDLNLLFNDWRREAVPLLREAWEKRGFWQKLQEWGARRIEDYL